MSQESQPERKQVFSRPHIWLPPAGFRPWRACGRAEFDRANRDGIPTFILEYRYDDQYLAQHYVANYLPGRPIE